MMVGRLAIAACLVGLVVIACGGGGSGGGTASGDGDGGVISGGGGTCTGAPAQKACDYASACGGDIVGTWRLVTFCGPRCVKSLSEVVTFSAGGDSSSGAWKYGSNNTVTTTVGNASSTASYCVQGDTLWLNRGTNCGPTDPGSVRSQWQRDCGGTGTTPAPRDAGLLFDGAR